MRKSSTAGNCFTSSAVLIGIADSTPAFGHLFLSHFWIRPVFSLHDVCVSQSYTGASPGNE